VSRPPSAPRRSRSTGRRAAPPPPSRAETWGLVLVALGGVAVLPGALNRFVFPKWALTAGGIATALRAPARGRLPTPVLVLAGIGIAALVAAALTGVDPVGQLVGPAPRYEGLPAVLLYVGAAAAGARLLGPGRHRDQDVRLVRVLTVGAVAVALVAAVETAGLAWWQSDVTRPGSLLGNASDQGAWAVLVLGPLLLAAVRAPACWSVLGTLAALTAVVLSGSRGALIGAALVLLVAVVVARDVRRRLLVIAVGVATAAAGLAVPGVRARLLGEGLAGQTVVGRGDLWRESITLLREHPVLGVGPGGFAEEVRGVHDAAWYAEVGTGFPPDSPHTWPLQALLAGGPVLLLAALGLVALTVRAAYRVRNDESVLPGLAAGLVGYGVALLVHFTGPGHTPLAAVFAGALLAIPLRHPERRHSPPARAASMTAAVAAAVAVAGAVAEVPLRQAVVFVQEERAADADESFRLAQALRPWDDQVAVTAGHAFRVVGIAASDPDSLERAERWLAVEGADRSVPVLSDLGAVREARGDLAGAAAALTEAVQRDPANPDLLLLTGVVAARQNHPEQAETLFLKAAASAPESPAPWENLTTLYRETDRPAETRAAQAAADARG
jgi:tetratricopeptide (TPR) repeat protein